MTIQEIEQSIARLPADKLAEFRAWFETFDADQWDRQWEKDAQSGKLDQLAADALEEVRQGNVKEL